MNHVVEDVQGLYEEAKNLLEEVVKNQADVMINDLNLAINILKNSWKGADAGVQINNVVEIYNGMAQIRNALAVLSKDSSTVAANYREIQRLNSANLSPIAPLEIGTDVQPLDDYHDSKDTINITPEAAEGRNKLEAVAKSYDDFQSATEHSYNVIMDNWKAGNGRDSADEAFYAFMNNSSRYKETLLEVAKSITSALSNYQI